MYIIRFRVKFASYRNFDELAKVTELFTKPKKEIVGIIFFFVLSLAEDCSW